METINSNASNEKLYPILEKKIRDLYEIDSSSFDIYMDILFKMFL